MGYIGCLGDIPFGVSSSIVQTVQNVNWSGSARYKTHERHLTHALTEFTGLEPDEFTFDIYLSAFLGVKPMDAITALWDYERSGRALSLVLGDHAYGKYRWTVVSHKIKAETFDANGNILTAKVTVKLKEYMKGEMV